jgi:hypothetical protein
MTTFLHWYPKKFTGYKYKLYGFHSIKGGGIAIEAYNLKDRTKETKKLRKIDVNNFHKYSIEYKRTTLLKKYFK